MCFFTLRLSNTARPVAARNSTLILALLLSLSAGCATTQPGKPRSSQETSGPSGSRVPEQVKPDLYPKGAMPEAEPVVRSGRYTLISTTPRAEQKDLLSQIVDVTVPQAIKPTVHDALAYVLQRSGYGLCAAQGDVGILYGLPLPASQYQLGPMTLRNAIQILAGPAWQVVVNEVSRSICFEKRDGYQRVADGRPTAPPGGGK